MTSKCFHAIVHGRVQRVFFRAFASDKAVQLGLNGFVRNLSDGTVEVVAEGDEKKLEEFLGFLHKGPPAALVKKVDFEWKKPSLKFTAFSSRY